MRLCFLYRIERAPQVRPFKCLLLSDLQVLLHLFENAGVNRVMAIDSMLLKVL